MGAAHPTRGIVNRIKTMNRTSIGVSPYLGYQLWTSTRKLPYDYYSDGKAQVDYMAIASEFELKQK